MAGHISYRYDSCQNAYIVNCTNTTAGIISQVSDNGDYIDHRKTCQMDFTVLHVCTVPRIYSPNLELPNLSKVTLDPLAYVQFSVNLIKS